MNKLILGAVGLAAVLVACPSPAPVAPPVVIVVPPSTNPPEAPLNPTGTVGSITDMIAGARALENIPNTSNSSLQTKFNAVNDSARQKVNFVLPAGAGLTPMKLLGAFKSGSLSALTSVLKPQAVSTSSLPRGAYDCRATTAASPNCVKTNSDDYKLVFLNTSSQEVTLFADWDDSSSGTTSPTQTFPFTSGGNTSNSEVPTKASVYLQVNTVKVLEARASATWETVTAKPFSGAANTVQTAGLKTGSLQGVARTVSGADIVVVRGFTYGFNSTANKITTTGDFSVIDTDTFRARWNFEIGMTPDSNNPLFGVTPLIGLINYKPNGDSKISASLEINADQYAFKFDTSNYVERPFAITIANGSIFQKGKTATFTGVLNDANGNCIPGDNLNVTTASGTATLQTILVNNFSVSSGSCPQN